MEMWHVMDGPSALLDALLKPLFLCGQLHHSHITVL